MAVGIAVVLRLLELLRVPLRQLLSTSGTRTTTTSARSTSKSCPTTGSTSASPSPTPRIRRCAAGSSCARSRTCAPTCSSRAGRHPRPPRATASSTSRPSAGRPSRRTSPSSAPRNGVKRWDDSQTDHGYNAHAGLEHPRPTLANIGPATDEPAVGGSSASIRSSSSASSRMTWWAFGWRALCVALAVFATNFPSRFYWTGGAFLRWDWLFYFVGGVCLVRKEKPLLGGLFLGYSTLLRVFPGFCVVGPGAGRRAAAHGAAVRDRPWWKPQPFANARELFGARRSPVAAVLRRPRDRVRGAGPREPGDEQRRRRATSTSTRTRRSTTRRRSRTTWACKTVMIYRPSEAGRVLKNDKLEDPWGHWKTAQARDGRERAPSCCTWRSSRSSCCCGTPCGASEPWVALSMGTMFMADHLRADLLLLLVHVRRRAALRGETGGGRVAAGRHGR